MTTPKQLLDDPVLRERLDPGLVGATLGCLPAQVNQAVNEARLRFPSAVKRAHTLVVVGMGGSALGADMVRGVLAPALRQQIWIVRSGQLPTAVRSGMVVLASSYSGTTAETLAATQEARRRRLPLAIMTTGGTLGRWAIKWQVPYFKIDRETNPSRQPRLATGSLAAGVLMTLQGLGWWRFSPEERKVVQQSLTRTWQRVHPEIGYRNNPLKQLAAKLRERFVLAIASEHYAGSAHILANQLNENAKTFATYFTLPELNHHLLEGLRFPAAARQGFGLFLRGMGDEELQQRITLTRRIFEQQKLPTAVLRGSGATPLAQAFSLLVQTSTLSYYLALLHRVDPSHIPWVDEFKRRLRP